MRETNIHGYCPHCKANFDGDLVINHPLSEGKTQSEALEYASHYAGWEMHRASNRWDRKIGIYDYAKDRTVAYKCPDCLKQIAAIKEAVEKI